VRRIFWLSMGLGAGATAAVMAGRWLRRQRQALAPANLVHQAGDAARDMASLVGEAARGFRDGMTEKEAEVRSSLAE
jgi:hypothetical protein